jgi:hypothetical protein
LLEKRGEKKEGDIKEREREKKKKESVREPWLHTLK